MRGLELITLPLRTVVLLVLLLMAYYAGYGAPEQVWRKESPEGGVVAKYTRNGLPWRTELRAEKTFLDFISNSRQVQYTAIALMVYTLLEFAVRSAALR